MRSRDICQNFNNYYHAGYGTEDAIYDSMDVEEKDGMPCVVDTLELRRVSRAKEADIPQTY